MESDHHFVRSCRRLVILESGKWKKCLDWTRPVDWLIFFMQFTVEMINSLTSSGMFFIHQIKNNGIKNLIQSWVFADFLDQNEHESRIWIKFLQSFANNNVYLSDKDDVFLWVKNAKGGCYAPNMGYMVLIEAEDIPPISSPGNSSRL